MVEYVDYVRDYKKWLAQHMDRRFGGVSWYKCLRFTGVEHVVAQDEEGNPRTTLRADLSVKDFMTTPKYMYWPPPGPKASPGSALMDNQSYLVERLLAEGVSMAALDGVLRIIRDVSYVSGSGRSGDDGTCVCVWWWLASSIYVSLLPPPLIP